MNNSLSTLLKESWGLVEERKDKLAGYFYARIFLTDPNLRDLFPITMDVQRSRLLGALVTAVQTVDDPDRFEEYLLALGRDHRKFYVEAKHYDVLGGALIEALRTFAGNDWTPAYDQAWRDAYQAIAAKMIAGADADSANPPYWHAEVIRHELRCPDVAVLTCRPLQPLGYRAGQYVSVESMRRPREWRVYSVANAPRRDGTLDLHVRAVDAGSVSAALVRNTWPGDMLRLGAPMGSMTVDHLTDRDIVCIAGGTGIAPIKAIVEEELTHPDLSNHNVTVFFGARTTAELYELPCLTRLKDIYPRLTVVPATSDDPDFPGQHGNIADVMAQHGPWTNHNFFVSGSQKMVSHTLRVLAEMEIPEDRIQYDAFGDT